MILIGPRVGLDCYNIENPRIGTSDYDGKRLPAWTDRVLFKANVANYDSYKLNLRQHSYNVHQHFMQSDHKVLRFALSCIGIQHQCNIHWVKVCFKNTFFSR